MKAQTDDARPETSATWPDAHRWPDRGRVLRLSVGRITVASSALAAGLVVASLLGQVYTHATGHDTRLAHFLNIDEEGNAPTFLAVSGLMLAAALSALAAAVEPPRAGWGARGWRWLALGFLAMAFDEACMVHERLVNPVRALLGGRQFGIFYYAWVIPYGLFVLLILPYFVAFLSRLPRPTGRALVLAGVLYLGGTLGVELVGGRVMEQQGHTLIYDLLATLEESLEFGGTILYNDAVGRYLASQPALVRIQFTTRRSLTRVTRASDATL